MDMTRILVVDDDNNLREMIKGVLEESGYSVDASADAGHAMKLLDSQRFDLVITDKNLPGIDGHTLINEIWMRHPGVGTVMITGYRSAESEERARQQYVLAYLEKPLYDMAIVPQVVESALELQRKRLGRT